MARADQDLDASLLAVAAVYDVLPVDDPVVRATVATVAAVQERLVDAGVHRYETDTYYGGGQWPVLGCLLAWHHARAGAPDRAARLLHWAAGTAHDLLLPEQVPPMLARTCSSSGSSGGARAPTRWCGRTACSSPPSRPLPPRGGQPRAPARTTPVS